MNERIRAIVESRLKLWGIPKKSHDWKDYEAGKRNLAYAWRFTHADYRDALRVLAEWVGV